MTLSQYGKLPFPRSQQRFLEALLDSATGHNHDGVNSAKIPIGAMVVNDGAIDTVKIADTAVTAAKLAAAAVGSAQLADGAVGDTKLQPHIIQTATARIVSADVKTLNATPVELIAAPGADHFIEVVSIMLFLDYGGSNVFAADRTLDIGYNDAAVSVLAAAVPATFHQAAADRVFVAQVDDPLEQAAAAVVDQNIAITALAGEITGNAGGDNIIDIVIAYRIHQLA